MKRYLLFAYDQYYPSGGWWDFKKDFDDLEEAKEAARASSCDHRTVVDTQTGKEVVSI